MRAGARLPQSPSAPSEVPLRLEEEENQNGISFTELGLVILTSHAYAQVVLGLT
jgi:hypothetical protein